ncbi:hypothetical protein PUN4_340262 [Paraburkholderia unamae]|nr:hypothetical protein PUN4_340262 [Paraburkholderia unamae]
MLCGCREALRRATTGRRGHGAMLAATRGMQKLNVLMHTSAQLNTLGHFAGGETARIHAARRKTA